MRRTLARHRPARLEQIHAWVMTLLPVMDTILLRAWRTEVVFADDIETIVPIEVQGWWREMAVRLLARTAGVFTERVVREIRIATEKGLGELSIGAILKRFLVMMDWQIFRIARTETMRAYNLSQIYATAKMQDVQAWRYEVIVDERTSAICRPIANKIVTRLTLTHVPPLHPHCRTILLPLFAEDIEVDSLLDKPIDAVPQQLPDAIWRLLRNNSS